MGTANSVELYEDGRGDNELFAATLNRYELDTSFVVSCGIATRLPRHQCDPIAHSTRFKP
jgi:hypothetical protein